MMHAECLVRTPARPWSPGLHNTNEHNDSGISPGRSSSGAPSTSPHSPQRQQGSPDSGGPYPQSPNNGAYVQSPANGSLPRSPANSSGYPLSPTTQSTSPAPEGSLDRLKYALERSSVLAVTFKQEERSRDEDSNPEAQRKEYPCPLCAYTTPYRHRYMEHVSTHYADKCTICDFKGQSAADLRVHLSEAHGIGSELGDLSDPIDPTDQTSDGHDENDNPRRLKQKHFRCKQCPFVTSAKVDFWEHTKTHIKADKLLTCPKCPFVTEYKHHLEYHTRNHFGSKPYKCNKCTYSCVNKSMLNSHLKSHSNIYQYRCADCAYATKYCHSLKLHLRKYDHSPAMVLNQDGSPNPLPIIDVYGTRRGPKPKPKSEDSNDRQDLPGGVIVPSSTGPMMEHHNQPKLIGCNLCEFYTVSLEILNQHMYMHAAESPFAQMMRTNNNLPDQTTMKDYFDKVFHNVEQHPPPSPLSLASPNHSPITRQVNSPLDLTKTELESKSPGNEKKSRRKGKAYKLERIQQPSEHLEINGNEVKYEPMVLTDVKIKQEITSDKSYSNESPEEPQNCTDDQEIDVDSVEDETLDIKIPTWPSQPTEVVKQEATGKEEPEGYDCNFCYMGFKDVVMYTMHMGYHGFRDPFTCNMCGQTTPNRVAFFLHIARSSHS